MSASWYEQAIQSAGKYATREQGRDLFVAAARAARNGLCTPGEATHVQNKIARRARLFDTTPVDVEDLARQAAEHYAATREDK